MPTSPPDGNHRGQVSADVAPEAPVEVPFDVAVIGAGPAGLSAAVSAADTGARVALIDGARRVGGQYWRHRDGDDGSHHTGWSEFSRLQSELAQHAAGIDVLCGYSIWQVETLAGNGFRIHATVDGQDRTVGATTVVVATGAYDRQLPFPGWTLPGVFTAGAAQALLKGHGVLAGSRIVVAGTGPFLLAVAAGLAEGGADVAGVFEAGGAPTAFARHPVAVARNLVKLGEGAHYARVLMRHRIPYRTHTTVVAAQGDESVTGAVVAKLDGAWNVVEGTRRVIDCDTIAVGYGFTPQTELVVQLGCDTRMDGDGSLVAVVDEHQRSSVRGVYVAGEATGIGGAALSVVEGEIAGRHAAEAAGRAVADPAKVRRSGRARRTHRQFAEALQEGFPVRPGWMSWTTPDTIVCRCEEVTCGRITEAVVELGADDPRAAKLYARPGMGLCQGRVCGYATTALVAAQSGRTPTVANLQGVAGRPIAAPITLGALAAVHRRESAEPPTSPPRKGI